MYYYVLVLHTRRIIIIHVIVSISVLAVAYSLPSLVAAGQTPIVKYKTFSYKLLKLARDQECQFPP